jgi:hypothetical protein
MWLTGRLAPDHKTIADFRKDNGPAIKKACAQFCHRRRNLAPRAHADLSRHRRHRSDSVPSPQSWRSILR